MKISMKLESIFLGIVVLIVIGILLYLNLYAISGAIDESLREAIART